MTGDSRTLAGFGVSRGPGGGGNASVGVLLRQAGEHEKGIFISHSTGTLAWHAQGEQRSAEEAEVRAKITVLGRNNANKLEWSLPSETDWPAIPPEAANRMPISWTNTDGKPTGRIPFTGGPGVTHESYLDVTHPTPGPSNKRIRIFHRPATDPGEYARVVLQGEDDSNPGTKIDVMEVRFATRGLIGNNYFVQPRTTGGSSVSTLLPGLRFNGHTIDVDSTVTGLNQLARGSVRFVARSLVAAGTQATLDVGTFRLTGGTPSVGSPRNLGVDIDPDDGGEFLDVALEGAQAADVTVTIRHNESAADGTVGPEAAGNTANARVFGANGSVTLKTIADAINNQAAIGGVKVVAAPADGERFTDAVTFDDSDSETITLTGGAANDNTSLSATFTSGTLNVFAASTDSLTDIEDAIEALDEFGASDVVRAPTSVNTDTITGLGDRAESLTDPAFRVRFLGGAVVPQLGFSRQAFSFFYENGVTTLKALKDVIVGQTYGSVVSGKPGPDQTIGAADVVITGDETNLVQAGSLPANPTGGRNHVPAGLIELEARPDDETDGPNILIKYDASETLQNILDEFTENNNGGFVLTMVYGTNPDANPEAAPFVRSFLVDEAVESSSTAGLNRGQVDARVQALTKGYALRGGGDVAESDIPDAITRDSEVTSIVGGVSAQPLSTSQDDQPLFLGAGGNLHKTTTQLLRALMKGYVGPWADTPGGFVFRKGDFTDHHGRMYWVNAATSTKNTSDGPETNSDFTIVDQWGGAWSAGWFKAGTFVTHSGNLYFAASDVINTDPAPDAAGNTKWLRISNEFIDGGNWSSSAGTYAKHTFVYHATQKATYLTHASSTAATIEPGVTANWESHYIRIGYADGAPSSIVDVSVTGSQLRLTTRGGTHHDETLPSGATDVEANPAGTDGDPLTRIAIGGTNYVVDAEVPVGMGLLAGRVTSTDGKFPANLPDHTNPIRVPIPTYGDLTDAESPGGDAAAWKAASRDWPVIPILAIGADGGFLSNLDTTESSVQIQEGMYIVGSRAQNIWVDNIHTENSLSGSIGSTDFGNPRAPNPARIIAEILVEYLDSDGSTWLELSKTFGPYTRRAPYANQVTQNAGSTSAKTPGSDDANDGTGDNDYDGTRSPVTASMYTVITVPPGGLTIRFRLERGDSMAAVQVGSVPIVYDAEGFPNHPPSGSNRHLGGLDGGTVPWGFFADIPGISLFPLGKPTQTEPLTPQPHITSFVSESGDLNPAAGSIAAENYGFTYTIAQGSHVGAARVIGFKGATKPSGSATVLATLDNFDHGSGTATIPDGITLAAGEEYRLRLQVFGEGVTPGPDTAPISYHDIVIEAHAPATAAYHVGNVAYDSNDADAAATAARITDFTGDTLTSPTLPDRLTIDIPAAAGDSDEFQLYLLAKADETQPSNFTSEGLPANSSFYAAEDIAIGGVDFKAYILRPTRRVTKADNGDYWGVS